jgi:hypothetical protein
MANALLFRVGIVAALVRFAHGRLPPNPRMQPTNADQPEGR